MAKRRPRKPNLNALLSIRMPLSAQLPRPGHGTCRREASPPLRPSQVETLSLLCWERRLRVTPIVGFEDGGMSQGMWWPPAPGNKPPFTAGK